MKQTEHQLRVEALNLAYKSGRTFPTLVKVRDFLNCTLEQAKRADLDARNDLNADPSTPVVVPAAKVPDPGTKDYARRSRGNADHDLSKLTAFATEVTSKARNLTFQSRKVSDKHPEDIDLMRFARDAAHLGQQAVSLTIEIDRVKNSRS